MQECSQRNGSTGSSRRSGERGAVRVSELSLLLDVSDMTIRRDLDALAAQGELDKVHGGATTKRSPSTDEPGFEAKRVRQTAEKEAIAAAAVALVEPGSAIGLSAGTTTWTLARQLAGVPDLTVVTNSTRVADVLLSSGRPRGTRRPPDRAQRDPHRRGPHALGRPRRPIAVASLESLHLDLVFLGVHGMDPRAGYTTPNMLEADTDRALVAAGRRLVVVADHTKWATVGISTIVELDGADVVVTDDHLPDGRPGGPARDRRPARGRAHRCAGRSAGRRATAGGTGVEPMSVRS